MDEVHDTFADAVKELPVSAFALYISSANSPLPDGPFVYFLRNLIEYYLPQSAPDPRTVDPEVDDANGVSVPIMERCYLPFAANNVLAANNAKFSLVVENLFRLLWVSPHGGIEWTPRLQKAVEVGVKARNEKPFSRRVGKAKGDGDDDVALDILRKSGKRLLTMINLVKMDNLEGIR